MNFLRRSVRLFGSSRLPGASRAVPLRGLPLFRFSSGQTVRQNDEINEEDYLEPKIPIEDFKQIR